VNVHQEGSFAARIIRGTIGSFAAGAADGNRGMAADYEAQLGTLAEALATGRPALLEEDLAWRKVAHRARGVPDEVLVASIKRLRKELAERLPAGPAKMAAGYLDEAVRRLSELPVDLPSLLEGDGPLVVEARKYLRSILEGDRDAALARVDALLDNGTSPQDLHEHVIARVQRELGRMWQTGEIHVGEEHFGSAVAEEALVRIRAKRPDAAKTGARILLAAVAGNLHDLGVRMVADHLRWAGHDTILLGANTPAEDVVRSAVDFKAELIVLSAHLATHVTSVARTIEAIRGSESIDAIPVLVGGPPFNTVEDLWEVVGANGVSRSAGEAAGAVARLLAG